MKSYFLRRNNVESGPFTLDELKNRDLDLYDMIRIGEDDLKWRNVHEVAELKFKFDQVQEKDEKTLSISSQSSDFSGNKNFLQFKTQNILADTGSNDCSSNVLFRKSRFKSTRSVSRSLFANSTRITSHISWFSVLAAVLLFDYFIIKSIVDSFNGEIYYHSALKNAFQKEPPPGEKVVDKSIQNALVKEIVTASDTIIKAKKTAPNKDEILSLTELKNLLQVKSNKYHVVASGGINDLKLTVYNQSPYFIDAVTVQVDYLKTRKRLVQTESFTTTYLKPNSSKTIHIPSNNKGKKVKYRITNVKASECKLRKFEI